MAVTSPNWALNPIPNKNGYKSPTHPARSPASAWKEIKDAQNANFHRRPGKDPNLGGGSSGGSSYSSYSGGGGYGGGYGGGGGGGGGGGSSTHTTTNLSSRAEARAVLYAGLQTVLGRKPTKGEVDAYYKALNVYEKKHPTTTTSSGDATTSTGGVSATMASQFTKDFVNKDADLKAEQGSFDIASKYMNAFISAISGPVR